MHERRITGLEASKGKKRSALLSPSEVLASSGLSLLELEARAFAFSVRKGVEVMEGEYFLRRFVDGLLQTEVDLSRGYIPFLQSLRKESEEDFDLEGRVNEGEKGANVPGAPDQGTTAENRAVSRFEGSFAPYFSPERMQAGYQGFACEDIARLFGFIDKLAVQIRLAKIVQRKKRHIHGVGSGRKGDPRYYDLRGISHYFIDGQGRGDVYHRDQALHFLGKVLEVEGVAEQYRKEDAQGILKVMDDLNPNIKMGVDFYNAKALSRTFIPAAVGYYRRPSEVLPPEVRMELLRWSAQSAASQSLRGGHEQRDFKREPEVLKLGEGPSDESLRSIDEEKDRSKVDHRGELVLAGRNMSGLFALAGAARDLLSPVRGSSVEDFLNKMGFAKGIISDGEIYADAERLARTIYDKVRDKITAAQYQELILDHSRDERYRDAAAIEVLFLKGRTAAMLERAGIREITLERFQRMYDRLGRAAKIGCFSKARRVLGYMNTKEVWGERWLERVKYGTLEVQEVTAKREIVRKTVLKEDSSVGLYAKREVYDALVMLQLPWLFAVHKAVLGFAMYIREEAKIQLREAGVAGKTLLLLKEGSRTSVISGSSGNSGNGRDHREALIPTERCDPAYSGLTILRLTEIFGYSSTEETEQTVARAATHYSKLIPVHTRKEGEQEVACYDPRGNSEFLLRAGIEGRSTVTATREEALHSLSAVLEAEGVREEFRAGDSERLLKAMIRLDHGAFKVGNRYVLREMRTIFRRAVAEVYLHSSAGSLSGSA